MKNMTDMAEHYVVTATNNFSMTREGHPRFLNWLLSVFRATKDYWGENGVQSGLLLNATYTCQAYGNQIQAHKTMNAISVDTRLDEFQIMYKNLLAYPPSIIPETQSEFDKIMSEEV